MSNQTIVKHPQDIVRSPFRYIQHLLGKLLPQKTISERSSMHLILQTISVEELGRNEPVITVLTMYLTKYFGMVPHFKNPRVFLELEKMEKQLIDLKSAIEKETGKRPQPLIRSAIEEMLVTIRESKTAFPHLLRPPAVDVLERRREYLIFLSHQLEMDRVFLERYAQDIGETKVKNATILTKLKAELKAANKHWLKWNGAERRAFIQLAGEIEKEHDLLQDYLRSSQQPYVKLRGEVEDALTRLDSQAHPIRFAERAIVSITHRYDLMYFDDFEAKIKDPTDWMLRAAQRKATAAPSKKQPLVLGPECTNCTVTGLLKPCSRCRTVWYCGVACQTQHWKQGQHKRFCVAVADRVPSKSVATMASDEETCVVCLDPLISGTIQTLGCGHALHAMCWTDVESFGVARACPTCRHGF